MYDVDSQIARNRVVPTVYCQLFNALELTRVSMAARYRLWDYRLNMNPPALHEVCVLCRNHSASGSSSQERSYLSDSVASDIKREELADSNYENPQLSKDGSKRSSLHTFSLIIFLYTLEINCFWPFRTLAQLTVQSPWSDFQKHTIGIGYVVGQTALEH
jgi:hypothetical protein